MKKIHFIFFFKDELVNHKIAEKIIEKKMTFSDVKNMMKRLLLKDKENRIESVNANSLYEMIMEEENK